MANKDKILIVRKMSALEYHYNGNHNSEVIINSHKNHMEGIERIEKILRERKVDYDIITRKELKEGLIEQYSAVISAGGDGTVIATAYYNKKTPQLNIRTDEKSVGALCQKDIDKSLSAFLNQDYKIEEWNREEAYLDGKYIGRALNDVCAGQQLKFSRYSRYDISFIDEENKKKIEERQGGSGIVIVTGTGSTGWPAAFKGFPRDSNYLKFRTLFIHEGKVDAGTSKEISLTYKGHEGLFSVDSVECPFPRDSVLTVKISDYPLKVIIPN